MTDGELTGEALLTPEALRAPLALGQGLIALRASVRAMLTSAVGGGAVGGGAVGGGAVGGGAVGGGTGQARTRNRPVNDAPTRHQPGGNTRTAGRRYAPGRQPAPDETPGADGDDTTQVIPRGDDTTQVIPNGEETTQVIPNGEETTRLIPAAGPDGDGPDRPGPPPTRRGRPGGAGGRPEAGGPAAAEVVALVERARAGDAEAFGLIYDRYLDQVFRFVYYRVGDRQLAEDLTSETFLRALRRIGSFTWQGRDPGAWLVTIARNLVADHFKSGRYRLEVSTGEILDADRAARGAEGRPEAAVLAHVTNVVLLDAVKRLNPEQQECIVLRFLLGLSVAETAQSMGRKEGAVKALQYRAVRALARLLPDGFES